MKARFIGAAAVALGAAAFVVVSPAHAATGIHVSGTDIVESNGNPFVLRGTSHAHAWYATQTRAFEDIKSLGANTVRVVLSGGRWTANGPDDVANVVSLCKQNKLICVLENHDTTGYGEQSGAYTMAQAVSYWTSLKSVLQGQEDYVIINIGNEPFGNGDASSSWPTETANAIKALRNAGFEHALMVDAPNWGQDWQFIMRDNAATVAAADPNKNTIFSVHMYGVFDTAAEVTSYVQAFKTKGLPLVIGEFGFNHSDGDPDEVTIMNQSIGWLGWSWSGNGGGVEYLDQVTGFDVNSLTSWGTQLFTRITEESQEATVYGSRGAADASATGSGDAGSGDTGSGDTGSTGTGSTTPVLTIAPTTPGTAVDTPGAVLTIGPSGPGPGTPTTSRSTSPHTPAPTSGATSGTTAASGSTTAPPRTTTTRRSSSTGGTTGSSCTATYSVQDSWSSGFVATVRVSAGGSPVGLWRVTLRLPSGATIGNLWNGKASGTSGTVQVSSMGYNGRLGSGASTEFGFQGTGSGRGVTADCSAG